MWLAAVAEPADEASILIGACMGVHRAVFERIRAFDEELVPGATDFGEETFLWRQMKEAGMRILPVRDTHEYIILMLPDSTTPVGWLRHGSMDLRDAYVKRHWDHEQPTLPLMQSLILRVKLFERRRFAARHQNGDEGCAAWEMSYLFRLVSLR